MKKMRLIILTIIALTSTALLPACRKPNANKCISYTNAPVTKVEGQTTGSVNQEINLTVSFGCFNGCGSFGKFEQTTAGDTTIVKVIAKYEGCVCTQDAPTRQTIYKFKATKTGTYYLKFLQAEKTYLTHSIIIL